MKASCKMKQTAFVDFRVRNSPHPVSNPRFGRVVKACGFESPAILFLAI